MCILHVFLASFLLDTVTTSVRTCREGPSQSVDSYVPTIFNNSNDCECDGGYNTCVRKCCDLNYRVSDNKSCSRFDGEDVSVSVFEHGNVKVDFPNVVYAIGINKCDLDDDEYYLAQLDEFFIQKDGRLWLSSLSTYFTSEEYCLVHDKDVGVAALLCILDYDIQGLIIWERLTVVGMIISLPFLFATFVVYAVLPERRQYGNCLMCYVFSLFVNYLLSVISTLHPDREHFSAETCRSLAALLLFFAYAVGFWMNAISIDISLTFSGVRRYHINHESTEDKRFRLYNIYAWGFSLLYVILVFVMSSAVKPNKWYNPGLTDQQCWLNEGLPMLIYFHLPITVLVIINIILFAKTACHIKQLQNDTAMVRRHNSGSRSEEERTRYGVFLKLFMAMGLNWSLDIVAWIADWTSYRVPRAIWYVTDFCNAAIGMFIFLIFVCKKKTWLSLKRRFCSATRLPNGSKTCSLATKEVCV